MSNWFRSTRVNWVVETVQIYGFINRRHLCRKFGVSKAQAAIDMKAVLAAHPTLMNYNAVRRRYEFSGVLSDGAEHNAISGAG